jgi:hypothetical protein
MKYYLLIAGDNYYPQSGTEDWKGTYYSAKEALDQVKVITHETLYTKGKDKGKVKESYERYEINGRTYDWYDIVDLKGYIL